MTVVPWAKLDLATAAAEEPLTSAPVTLMVEWTTDVKIDVVVKVLVCTRLAEV